ncbi:MAG TPA: amidohydrolase family protein [Rectinemataceae bacterium]|nr:amidohydrolase family protein [Rectinemataceae bacterium]
MTAYALTDATVVTPRKIRGSASVRVEDGKVTGFGLGSRRELKIGSASIVFPALVNVHDHLRGNYLPRVGPAPGSFYLNWAPWDADLKASPVYKERSSIDVATMYKLGAYKNLFSGVGTVNDHFPHELNEAHLAQLPIRVIKNYCLAHECSSFDLGWGEGVEIEHRWAVERDWPFITHLEEGFDPESQDGIGVLERADALDEHDLLVHCIGFSDEDIRKVKRAQASVAWCPASNRFMFNLTCKIRKMLRAGVNVALGTDSTHTGSVNLLEEMRFARSSYRELYGEELPAKSLFEMVSSNAAKALRMEGRVGIVEPGAYADFAVFRTRADDPYESLCASRPEDLELLTVAGSPVLGDEDKYGDFFSRELEAGGYGRIDLGGRATFVKGEPAALYRQLRSLVGFDKKLDYLPFEP